MPNRSLEQIRREIRGKVQTFQNYAFRIDREQDVDLEARTVKLAFASDKPIDNWWYGAIKLQMGKSNVRTQRLETGAPLLMDHNTRDQVGVIESYSFDSDGIARATVRFGNSQRAEEIFNDVRQGIRQNVSVGFMIWELNLESKKKDEPNVYRADDWEPYEISIVAVPADISVGVGRAAEDMPADGEDICPDCGEPMDACECADNVENSSEDRAKRSIPIQLENTMPNEEKPDTPVVETRSAAELAAIEINRWGDLLNCKDKAERYLQTIDGEPSVDEFRKYVREATPPPPQIPLAAPPAELARTMPRHGAVTSFSGENREEKAYRFGNWLLGRALYDANFAPCHAARKFCEEKGLLTRAMGEGTNETGGFLVPPEFGNDLIDLREKYGVFRANAKIVPMASDTKTEPVRSSGLTAYYVAEAGSITASDLGWGQVELVTKKLAALARYSTEVSEDSIIDFGNTLADEIAYAFSNKEDDAGFNGDGSSTYGGIQGIRGKLKAVDGTIANIKGLKVGTGNAYSELILADFRGTVALLPQYADGPGAKWFVHRSFYWNVMVAALLAGGGVTAMEIEEARREKFLGYPVVFSQVMPSTEGNSQVCAILGDLRLGALLGTRRDVTVAFSEHSRFANDQIEVRGTERFDINVHGVGDTTNAGPIVGLITAAS